MVFVSSTSYMRLSKHCYHVVFNEQSEAMQSVHSEMYTNNWRTPGGGAIRDRSQSITGHNILIAEPEGLE